MQNLVLIESQEDKLLLFRLVGVIVYKSLDEQFFGINYVPGGLDG